MAIPSKNDEYQAIRVTAILLVSEAGIEAARGGGKQADIAWREIKARLVPLIRRATTLGMETTDPQLAFLYEQFGAVMNIFMRQCGYPAVSPAVLLAAEPPSSTA